jgi:hypothetical protein
MIFSPMLCGALGLILISVLFDWALILLSSLNGACMIVHGLTLERSAALLVYFIALASAIAFQASLLGSEKRRFKSFG